MGITGCSMRTKASWNGATTPVRQLFSKAAAKKPWTLTFFDLVLFFAGVGLFLFFIEPMPRNISGTGSHTCALIDDGAIECWGSNSHGQLGAGLPIGMNASSPVGVVGISGATLLSAGPFHTCTVVDDRTVKCWGRNDYGQLGNAKKDDSPVPVEVKGIKDAVAVAVGAFHSCALLNVGAVECWGSNEYSQLGDHTFPYREVPVRVTALSGVIAITAGGGHNCAIRGDRTVYCWGWNSQGQLGIGSNEDIVSTPAQVLGLEYPLEVSAGDLHTCGIVDAGGAYCWGQFHSSHSVDDVLPQSKHRSATSQERPSMRTDQKQSSEQLVRPRLRSNVPVHVEGVQAAARIYAGQGRNCAILGDRSLTCWERDEAGSLSEGESYRTSRPPFAVTTVKNVVHFANSRSPCALDQSYRVLCWRADGLSGVTSTPDAIQIRGRNNRWLTSWGINYAHQ